MKFSVPATANFFNPVFATLAAPGSFVAPSDRWPLSSGRWSATRSLSAFNGRVAIPRPGAAAAVVLPEENLPDSHQIIKRIAAMQTDFGQLPIVRETAVAALRSIPNNAVGMQ